MLVETIVKDACTYLNPAPEFYLASLAWFNDVADKLDAFPVCLMEDVTPGHPVLKSNGMLENVYDVSCLLLDAYQQNDPQDVFHSTNYGGLRHAKVTAMRTLADQLLQAIAKDVRIFKPDQDIFNAQTQSVYNLLDMNLDGAHLTFSLRLYSAPLCVDKHP